MSPDPWQPVDGKCNARKTDGSGLCRHRAGWNTDHTGIGQCSKHGGRTPSANMHAGKVRLATSIGELLERHKPAIDEVDPVQGLLEVVRSTWGMRRVLEGLVAELMDQPAGELLDIDGEGGMVVAQRGLYGPDRFFDQKSHVLVTMLREWTMEHARACKLAIDAGIEERRIRVAEAHMELIAQALRGALVELGVWDRPETPGVVERQLRLVAAGETG